MKGTRINILSIDFDYFFPNPNPYDWGHNEDVSEKMLRILWNLREYNVKLYDKKEGDTIAINDFHADLFLIDDTIKRFKVTDNATLYIRESHAMILECLCSKSTIYNFDAHHDIYSDGALNCGNWAWHAINMRYVNPDQYHVIYPKWRLDNPDFETLKINTHYEIPELPVFDKVFVCRSLAWCPTWSEKDWVFLLKRIKMIKNFSESLRCLL